MLQGIKSKSSRTISLWMWNFNSIGREASAYKPHCYGCMQSTASIELLDPTKHSRLVPLTHKRQKVPWLLQESPQSNFMSHLHFLYCHNLFLAFLYLTQFVLWRCSHSYSLFVVYFALYFGLILCFCFTFVCDFFFYFFI